MVHHVRTTDPPARPPVGPESGEVRDRLREAHVHWAWEALGLDPSTDAPERSTTSGELPDAADEDQD